MCGLQNGLSLSRQKHQTCLRCAEFFRVSLDECEPDCCFHILFIIPLRLPSWLIRFYWDNIVSIKFQESIIYIGSNDELQLYTSKSCSSPLNWTLLSWVESGSNTLAAPLILQNYENRISCGHNLSSSCEHNNFPYQISTSQQPILGVFSVPPCPPKKNKNSANPMSCGCNAAAVCPKLKG